MTAHPNNTGLCICDWCGELNDPYGPTPQPCMCMRWVLAHAPVQLRPLTVRQARRAA